MYKIYAGNNPVLILAADELVKYGKGSFEKTSEEKNADILLCNENTDKWQDSFSLESREGKLFISGSNPRSVLFGVYEYLKKAGFDFLYPGKEGEIIPENPEFSLDGFHIKETASRTFRGIAARPDADNLQEGYDLISYMAKNKYNLFFMEGYDDDRPGDEYSVIDGEHPLQHVEHALKGKSWEERKSIALKQKTMVDEARRHGLIIERAGHGWNYGVPEHYGKNHGLSPEEARAELKAKGKVNKQAEVAVSTWFQICICREEVREIYADHIISYLKKHKDEIDIAAIWMGDGYDNKCQCEECIKQPFSDMYLDIFRRVALRAKEELPGMLLEALVYFETLEPPTRNYLEGLDNVIINLAVWRHCYFHKLDDSCCRLPDWNPDYRHNRTHDVANGKRLINYDQFVPYLGWRKVVGDEIKTLLFTYNTLAKGPDRYFMTYDLTLLAAHLADYDRHGFDGMVNCQCHCSWDKPTGLQLYGAARILWNKEDNNPQKIRRELFDKLFGDKSEQVISYCDKVAQLYLACGDYHEPITGDVEKSQQLFDGFTALTQEAAALGPLPCQREKYFVEVHQELVKIAEDILKAAKGE